MKSQSRKILFLLTLIATVSCQRPAFGSFRGSSHPQNAIKAPAIPDLILATELTSEGNQSAGALFHSYLGKGGGCRATTADPRVILTGFGPFSGSSVNPSGTVIANMASSRSWPTSVDLSGGRLPESPSSLRSGRLSTADYGGRATNRKIEINGQSYNVCFLVVDTRWDLGGAILATEMQRFQPALVIMTGRTSSNSVKLESDATNQASQSTGYDQSGKPLASDKPVQNTILDAGQFPRVQHMNWPQGRLAARIAPWVKSLGYSLSAANGPSSANDYICNNISYIALASIHGYNLSLAGGEISLRAKTVHSPLIGFMHIPDFALTGANVVGFAGVLANMIDESLAR